MRVLVRRVVRALAGLAAGCGLVALACGAMAGGQGKMVSLRALDGAGDPVAGVTVSFLVPGVFAKAQTDVDGRARLAVGEVGKTTLQVVHPSVGEKLVTVVIPGGGEG